VQVRNRSTLNVFEIFRADQRIQRSRSIKSLTVQAMPDAVHAHSKEGD